MGFYRETILPRAIDKVCGTGEFRHLRRQIVGDLAGTVLEIGFGSGLNVPHYPDEVTEVLAVEPSTTARSLAERRIAERGIPVRFVGLDGQSLQLDDDSCDAALCTFTLCTIPDAHRALLEVHRVLRPGGALHVLEHGLSPEPKVQRWQHRLEPIQRRVADGCHLTRQPTQLLEGAGFEIARVDHHQARGPKPWTWITLASGRTPAG